MRLICSLLVVLFYSEAAHAKPVTVRTGEHAAFTRVVLFIPDDVDWRVVRTDAGYVVRLPVFEGYNLNGFFDLIPRTRIAAVSQRLETGELELTLSCLCIATSYLLRDGILVIDVEDGPSESIDVENSNLDGSTPQFITTRATSNTSEWARAKGRVVPLFPDQNDHLFETEAALNSEVSLINGAIESVISGFEEQVVHALGEGLTENFLERDLAIEPPLERNLNEVVAATKTNLGDLPGVEARRGIDPMAGQGEPALAETQTGRRCLPDAFFAIKAWGDDRSFSAQVGAARLSIYKEFDRVDEVSVTSLAQTFLFFGFGQEALKALQIDQAHSQERQYLAQVARIIDDRKADFTLFEEQVSCPSSVALWALLASEDRSLDGPVARDVILRSFKELPLALQGAIGPRLSRAFVRLGDLDAGSQVLSRIQFDAAGSADSAVAASVFASAIQDETGAIGVLEEIIFDTSKATPELMVQYFETGMDAGRSFRNEDFALSNALRFQAAGSENSISLANAQIRAHISSDQFEEALEILQGARGQMPDALVDMLERQFATKAVERMSNGAFGRFAWSDENLPTAPAMRQLIAKRLIDMGFAERSAQVWTAERTQVVAGQPNEIDPRMVSSEIPNPVKEEAIELVESLNSQALVEMADSAASLGNSRNLIVRSASMRQELATQLQAIIIPETP